MSIHTSSSEVKCNSERSQKVEIYITQMQVCSKPFSHRIVLSSGYWHIIHLQSTYVIYNVHLSSSYTFPTQTGYAM